MSTPKPKKIANGRVRKLRSKLEALAQVGVDGERVNAQKKLERLLKRWDFVAPAVEIKDMFRGTFVPDIQSRWLYTFAREDMDIASAVKWALESATGLRAMFHGDELHIHAATTCLPRLTQIVMGLHLGIRALWDKMKTAPGILPSDRGLFIRGLWDGMMNDGRPLGEQLPTRRVQPARRVTVRKLAVTVAPGLGIHPYSVALPLGHKLRFETPLTDIEAELENAIMGRKVLLENTGAPTT